MGNTQSIAGTASQPERDALIEDRSRSDIHEQVAEAPVFAAHSTSSRTRRQRFSLYGTVRQRLSQAPQPRTSQLGLQELGHDTESEQDERPLVLTGSVMQSPMARQPPQPQAISVSRSTSSVSRIGSRFLPNSVARSLLSSGEETPAEGHALRNGTFDRWRSDQSVAALETSNRFSLTDSIRRRINNRSETRPDTRRQFRDVFPMNAAHHQLLGEASTESNSPQRDSSLDLQQNQISASMRRRRRLQRVRASLPNPLVNLFQSTHHRRDSLNLERNSTGRSARVAFADDSDQLLPPLTTIDHRLDLEETSHELDATETETQLAPNTSTHSTGLSAIRRLPSTFRSRSRLYRRQENPPLSQVLQLAAQAIATQLSTHTPGMVPMARPVTGDAFGGSIEDFVHTLQEAASAQAGEHLDVNTPEGELPPVNFMRVFQFPNDENGQPLGSPVARPDAIDVDQQDYTGEVERSVTLVLVGVRSMPPTHDAFGDGAGTSLDNILNLPSLGPGAGFGSTSPGAVLRRTSRARAQSRRHSMTNFGFPAQYESQRHRRPRMSSIGQADALSSITPISESPPGPHPPPSTPADIRSGHATPNRRPSSASAAHIAAALPDLDEDRAHPARATISQQNYSPARQRIRSDSEFARRPELSAGAARRNGVVEPDNVPAGTGRSWLIYVVGTNVSSDHPAFTMPSLFTDNPSYEDMQMLTTLLGPVKPPVASQEDVVQSGGLYRLIRRDGALLAESVTPETGLAFELAQGERCLICLCDYEIKEEVRQLSKCEHVYHRECIDEWLTTGRNSCPMCRGQGVEERNPSATGATESPPPSTDQPIGTRGDSVEVY